MLRIVLPSIAMIAVTYALARLSFGLFLPDISNALGLSESDGGFVGSTGYVSYSLALFISSFLIRKLGQRKVNNLAGLTAVIGLLGIATANSFVYLVIAVFVAGIGSGLASPALSQMATNMFTREKLDQANTWINSGTSFGVILTGPIVLLFTDQWRLSFFFFSFIAGIVLIWNYFIIPSNKDQKEDSYDNTNWLSVIKRAKFLITASLIIGICSSIFWTFSRSFITTEYDMTTKESVVFWIVMGAAGIVGGVAGGLIQRIGLGWSYRLILLVLLGSIAMLNISAEVFVYISAGLFGVTYILITGLYIVWATRIFEKSPAIGVSLSFLSLGIGQSLGSFLAGKTIEMTSYPLAFILFSILGLVGLFVPTESKHVPTP
ncbi:MFS transporter [Peribacillus sp. NPDC097675]|uniref:MFS transporter n=1 Tax=Peribacillus sp. NPDC097675 TaxID=3390618 RepID=UPI003D0009FC